MQNAIKKFIILTVVLAAIGAYFLLDLGRYLSLAFLQQQLDVIHNFYGENRLLSWLIFLLICVLVTALSIPGAAIIPIAAGAIFGLVGGVVIVSFASAMGATLASHSPDYDLKALHPEANFAAGEWKKAHAPQGLLKLVERYHRWQR